MLTNNKIKDLSIELIVKSVESFFSEDNKRKFQPLDLIMPKERFIRNKVGGLETSMGEQLWEPQAKGLARKNGFKILNGLDILEPDNSPTAITNTVTNVIEDRKNDNGNYNYNSSKQAIKAACSYFIDNPVEQWKKPRRGHGVDVWIEKDGVNWLFDTKTVQPNTGHISSFVEQLHRWYYFFYSKYPNANLNAAIVFPYNPYDKPFFEKQGVKPLEKKSEALDGQSFWKFITDNENAQRVIIDSFKLIGDEGLVTKIIDKAMNH